MDVIALPLTGRLYFFIPVPRATASPLPWADMSRPFRPSKMYKLQLQAESLQIPFERAPSARILFINKQAGTPALPDGREK